MNSCEQEAIDFMNWFCDLDYPHKIFICGNHDDCLYGANIDGLDNNVHYLCNSVVDYDDNINYGSEELLIRIATVKPHLHLFGHIHSQYEVKIFNNTIFSNGAIMNADYSNLRTPNLTDIF